MLKIILCIAVLAFMGYWFRKTLASFWLRCAAPWARKADDAASSMLAGDAGLRDEDIRPLSAKQAEEIRK